MIKKKESVYYRKIFFKGLNFTTNSNEKVIHFSLLIEFFLLKFNENFIIEKCFNQNSDKFL